MFRPQYRSLDRRGFLKIGMLGSMGLGVADVLRAQANGSRRDASVIILFMRGGPSQLDTWDMKPMAPQEFRGEFSPIATCVPGIQICELLPLTARIMDKWSIVRSLQHPAAYGDVSHSAGDQVVFTGYPPGRDPEDNVHPSFGSIAARQLQHRDPGMLGYVMIPQKMPGCDASYLGRGFAPFETLADPIYRGRRFEVPNLGPLAGVSVERMGDRRAVLHSFDNMRREIDRSGTMSTMDVHQRQAWEIVTGARVQNAFNYDAEPQSVKDRYGYLEGFRARMAAGGGNAGWNQRFLLARRLIEAGVRVVTVDVSWWDTHDDNFWSLKNGFLSPFDQAYSALIEDLEARGLLETTMVVAWGEHGRTPRINATAGRDHWMSAFSAALAGGGVRGGRAIGSTDAHAAVVRDNPKYPQDVLATIYRHLGVDTSINYVDHTGRPHPVLPFGSAIDELFS